MDLGKIGAGFKKNGVLIGLCTVIVFSCWYIMFRHYGSGGGHDDFVGKLETKVFDTRFLIRGPKAPNKKVGILAIDNKAIEQFGRWPFSRRYYAQAFKNLKGEVKEGRRIIDPHIM